MFVFLAERIDAVSRLCFHVGDVQLNPDGRRQIFIFSVEFRPLLLRQVHSGIGLNHGFLIFERLDFLDSGEPLIGWIEKIAHQVESGVDACFGVFREQRNLHRSLRAVQSSNPGEVGSQSFENDLPERDGLENITELVASFLFPLENFAEDDFVRTS